MRCEIKNCKSKVWTRVDFDPDWNNLDQFDVYARERPSCGVSDYVASIRICKKHHDKIAKQIAKMLSLTKLNNGQPIFLDEARS